MLSFPRARWCALGAIVLAAFVVLMFPLLAVAQESVLAPAHQGLVAQLWAWCLDHPLEAIGLVLYFLINLANRLASYPRAAGFRARLLVVIDFLSMVPHRDSPGLFTFPLLQRSQPPEGVEPVGPNGVIGTRRAGMGGEG